FKINSSNDKNLATLKHILKEENATANAPYHAKLTFEKDKDKAQDISQKGNGKNYNVSFVLEEEQSQQEYRTFMWLTIFTVSFGLLVLLFLKKLKKLTHGAEDNERSMIDD